MGVEGRAEVWARRRMQRGLAQRASVRTVQQAGRQAGKAAAHATHVLLPHLHGREHAEVIPREVAQHVCVQLHALAAMGCPRWGGSCGVLAAAAAAATLGWKQTERNNARAVERPGTMAATACPYLAAAGSTAESSPQAPCSPPPTCPYGFTSAASQGPKLSALHWCVVDVACTRRMHACMWCMRWCGVACTRTGTQGRIRVPLSEEAQPLQGAHTHACMPPAMTSRGHDAGSGRTHALT